MAGNDPDEPPLGDDIQQIVDLVIARLEKVVAGSPPDITLAHLRALRRETQAMKETHLLTLRTLNSLAERMDESFARVDENFARMARDMSILRGDIHTVQNTQHNHYDELLRVMRKLDHIDEDA